MHISWHGQYTVKIQTGDTTIVFDPYAPEEGLPPFRAKADVVALSNPSDKSMSHVSAIAGEPIVIDAPGEYARSSFTLHALGWHTDDGQERSLQRWQIEDVVLLHVGAINRDITDQEMQELEKTVIDILLLPVGGGSSFGTKQALSLVSAIEPRMVIPIHYHLPGLKEKLDSVEMFAKEMGVDPKQHEDKVIVKRKTIPQEGLACVLLKP